MKSDKFRLTAGMAVHWHPSVGPALLADSILVGEKGSEMLTPLENWPQLKVGVKGSRVVCPAILQQPIPAGRAGGTPLSNLGFDGDSVLG